MAEEPEKNISHPAPDSLTSTEMKDTLREQHQAQIDEHAQQAIVNMEAEAAAVIKHVWTSDDTYASLAFKYYGSIQEPYWRLIYNFNKAIIGNHPNDIRVGLEIGIPPLPEELKKK